jgi:DNA (cytosine-5)-methyltransferase 1
MTKYKVKLRAVSLFSNCGAGDLGFSQAGFTFYVMAELDPRRLQVALLNHRKATGVPGDLRATLGDVIAAYNRRQPHQNPDLLAACPPCQGMSSAQSARGAENDPDVGSMDHRNLLVEVISSAVRELVPRILVVENVQAFLTRQVRHPVSGSPISAARYLIDTLADDYMAYPLLADLADFGVPQSRKRCFLTFIHKQETGLRYIRDGRLAPYPRPTHSGRHRDRISLASALRKFNLPELDSASGATAKSAIPMHSVPVWPTYRYNMVNAIRPNSGLSAWENDACLACGRTVADRTRAICDCGSQLPRPVVRSRDGSMRLVTGFHSSYRRMSPNLPAATITTASGHLGSDRTIHPYENRVLSPLECALLQTFPLTFKWGDSLREWGHTNVRAMIGEAVPPLFTRRHGRLLASILQGSGPVKMMSATDQRVLAAEAALKRGEKFK